ncbi:hypothetical protein BSR54_10860 [Enterococcus faecium]|nr:hypothetical protein BSR54_10860 [Enterococcus faecium]OLZ02691.1 hypothetical protein BSQ81_02490 [Enterococcus faecium]OLZ05129.1 hypothetical protein BSQ84_02305 [Enterococcus faecium]OLZ07262.1 hypothetical protein BSQ83_02495 [Enterococcus faecium]OLZ16354.1 hypothetical protein BSQ82_02305 [Enterococcus faecium]
MSLPFNSESQGAISKNSFSCLLNSVTCDRGVGRRTPFIRKKRLRHDFCLSLQSMEQCSLEFFSIVLSIVQQPFELGNLLLQFHTFCCITIEFAW